MFDKRPKPYLVDDVPFTQTEIIQLTKRYGYNGDNLNIASGILRNRGHKIKHNKYERRF